MDYCGLARVVNFRNSCHPYLCGENCELLRNSCQPLYMWRELRTSSQFSPHIIHVARLICEVVRDFRHISTNARCSQFSPDNTYPYSSQLLRTADIPYSRLKYTFFSFIRTKFIRTVSLEFTFIWRANSKTSEVTTH